MEKENNREFENLNEEIQTEENTEEIGEATETAEVTEAVCEVAEEEEAEFAETDGEGEETVESEVEELSGEEAESQKKSRLGKGIAIAAAAIIVVAVCVVGWILSVEGIGSRSVVSNSMVEDEKALFDNIKYEDPATALLSKITGKNKNAVMTINGLGVDKDLFTYVSNSSTANYAYSLYQTGLMPDINAFDWDAVEPITGMTYFEYSKGMAVESCVPIYALVAEGVKKGIVLDEDEEKQLAADLADLKAKYGDEFDDALVQAGYPNENAFVELQRLQLHMQKVYEDVAAKPDKYYDVEEVKEYVGTDEVTVKHILIAFDEESTGDVTDEKKAAAKAEAEEVLAKVRNGEDFDKLIEEYNDDPGVTDEGYTFADDGTMVQEFTDASFALEVGEVSGIVETSYGYHIIKRMERAVSVDDYITMLQETAEIRIKRGNYNDVEFTLDLATLFGVSSGGSSANAEAEAAE